MYRLYILQCKDGTLYTGITTDIERRINEHNASTVGAKYMRGRGPAKLVFSRNFRNRSNAAKEEVHIKKLPRAKKLALIK
ncbi:GIY-YIG nuclease family protein [Patescibacteria group bacterium]|nr:GIY-YIG nuclease family protein [Patescibacteria group bacterium]